MFNDFSRNGHRYLSTEIKQALDDLEQRLGVSFEVGGGQFGADELKIHVVVKPNDPKLVEDKKRRELDVYGRQFGLRGEHYGAEFEANGQRFRLTGVNPGRPKFPLSAARISDGRSFKFPATVAAKIISTQNTAHAQAGAIFA